MTALIIASATSCRVLILDSPMACIIVGQSIAHLGRVFCVPLGVQV